MGLIRAVGRETDLLSNCKVETVSSKQKLTGTETKFTESSRATHINVMSLSICPYEKTQLTEGDDNIDT